jgi:hypothetical protein
VAERKFRFGVQGRTTRPRAEWMAMIRRIENLGHSSYIALDHFCAVLILSHY